MFPSSITRIVMSAVKPWIAWVWALGLFSAACSLVMPMVLGRVTNLFGGDSIPDMSQVTKEVFLGVAAMFAVAGCKYANTRIFGMMREHAAKGISLSVFERIVRAPAAFFQENETERVNNRAIADSATAARIYVSLFSSFPVAAVAAAAFGTWMLWTNFIMGVVMIPLTLLSGYFLLFDNTIRRVNQDGYHAYEQVRIAGGQTVAGVEEIRLNGVFEHGVAAVADSFKAYCDARWRVERMNAAFWSAGTVIEALQKGALQFFGAYLCIRCIGLPAAERMTWGDVMAYMVMVGLFQSPIYEISGLFLEWRMNRESISNVRELLALPTPYVSRPGAPVLPEVPPNVALVGVDLRLPSGARILSGLTIDVPAKSRVALVGPAGCGKSTTLNLISRQGDVTGGEIRIGGKNASEYSFESFASRVSSVTQRGFLFDASIRNNMLLPLRRPSASALIDTAGVLDVSRLGGVRTLADIDRLLIETTEQVGLHNDILHKALDNPIPPCRDALLERLSALRKAVAAGMKPDEIRVSPFSPDGIFPGSVAENLAGPGSAAAGRAEEALKRLKKGDPMVVRLAEIGWRCSLSDASRRAWAGRASPRLLRLLSRGTAPILSFRPVHGQFPRDLSWAETLAFAAVPLAMRLNHPELNDASAELERWLVKARHSFSGDSPSGAAWREVEKRGILDGVALRDNILFGRLERDGSAETARMDAAIHEAASSLGLRNELLLAGLEFRAGENGRHLSGGQRQKISLARALLKNPVLLLLDEATANLDEISQRRVMEALRNRREKQTVIMVSHRLSTIRDSDAIYVLDRGKVAETGSFDSLAAGDGLFRSLLESERGSGPPSADISDTAAPPPSGEDDRERMLVRDLALCPMLSGLDSAPLTLLARAATAEERKAGEVLFRRGELGEQVFLLMKGEVEFFAELPDGDRECVSRVCGGCLFGEMAMFGNNVRTLSAVAVTDVSLYSIPGSVFADLVESDPSTAMNLLREMARRLLEKETKLYGAIKRTG